MEHGAASGMLGDQRVDAHQDDVVHVAFNASHYVRHQRVLELGIHISSQGLPSFHPYLQHFHFKASNLNDVSVI